MLFGNPKWYPTTFGLTQLQETLGKLQNIFFESSESFKIRTTRSFRFFSKRNHFTFIWNLTSLKIAKTTWTFHRTSRNFRMTVNCRPCFFWFAIRITFEKLRAFRISELICTHRIETNSKENIRIDPLNFKWIFKWICDQRVPRVEMSNWSLQELWCGLWNLYEDERRWAKWLYRSARLTFRISLTKKGDSQQQFCLLRSSLKWRVCNPMGPASYIIQWL